MSKKEQRDEALAAEYVLGTLRGGAKLRFQRRLKNEPALAVYVARWLNLLNGMESQLKPVTPPETVWKRIALSLPESRRPKRYRPMLPWLAAASLLVAVLIYSVAFRAPALTPLAVLSSDQHQGQWIVSVSSTHDRIQLAPLHIAGINPGKSFELWAIPAGQSPVSLGVIKERASSNITIAEQRFLTNATLAVSLEPKGGSPTGQPTGPVLYSAKI